MEFEIKEEKLNNSGFIPNLMEGAFKSGEKTYFKKTNQMMGIFNGIGISQSILDSHTKHEKVLILFLSKYKQKYNGHYLAKMDDFRNSEKTFSNTKEDKQRFLSFDEMEKLG